MNSYQNSDRGNCYQVFLRLIQRGAQITEKDKAEIRWDDLRKRGCEHPELERLIKSKITTNQSL